MHRCAQQAPERFRNSRRFSTGRSSGSAGWACPAGMRPCPWYQVEPVWIFGLLTSLHGLSVQPADSRLLVVEGVGLRPAVRPPRPRSPLPGTPKSISNSICGPPVTTCSRPSVPRPAGPPPPPSAHRPLPEHRSEVELKRRFQPQKGAVKRPVIQLRLTTAKGGAHVRHQQP